MYSALLKSIQLIGRFSTPELQLLTSRLHRRVLPRGAWLVQQGQVCQSVFFLKRGSCRYIVQTEAGDEQVVNLHTENDWMADFTSLTTQKPAEGSILAHEECEVLELELTVVHELISAHPAFFQLGRLLELVKYPVTTRFSQLSPDAAYHHLLTTRPQLLQKFSLKHIAALLQITPETVSRVRRRRK
jgi:CRP-like cAMP-binding protein